MAHEAVVVAAPLSPELLASLSTAARVVQVSDDQPLDQENLREATALLISNTRVISADVVASAPRLKVISTVSVGLDHIDVAAATASNVLVCNTPGVLDQAVAELTLLLVLALSRKAVQNFRVVRDGSWSNGERLPGFGSDLRGKVLGVLGMGRTGRAVADLASRGFGMQVMYHNRSGPISETTSMDAPARYVTRDELFAGADFLTIHVDLNPASRRSVGRREFSLMKHSAFVINVSRGAVVDEEALIEALQSRRIAGAGLDVMDPEPPRPDNPLLAFENVVITPHIGSATSETRDAMAAAAVRNVLRVCSGQMPDSVVNPEAL